MKKYGIGTLMIMIITIILTGCFQGEQSMEEIDAPEDAEAVNNGEDASSSGETEEKGEKESTDEEDEADAESETVARQLYLVDADGMVVSKTLELPKEESKEVAQQSIEHHVKVGHVRSNLPSNWKSNSMN